MSEQQPERGGTSLVPEGVKAKAGPFPIWVWVVAGAAVVGIVLYIRSQNSGQVAAVGNPAVVDPGTGITSTDPLTADQLLQAIQQLSQQLQQNSQQQSQQQTICPPGFHLSGPAPGSGAKFVTACVPDVVPNFPPPPGGFVPWGPSPSQSPPPATPSGLKNPARGGEPDTIYALSSTHTTGGKSTARLSSPGIPASNSPATLRRAPRPTGQRQQP